MKSHLELMELLHSSGGPQEIPPVVLVVDDHQDTREMYDRLLSREGYWVAQAQTALEGLEYAQELKPDAIVTDLGLPGGMNGVDLIREIRADQWLRETPVVAVTGREPREVPSLTGVQVSALLLKPVAPETLLTRVKTLLTDAASLRLRAEAARAKVPALIAKSTDLLKHSEPHIKNAHKQRACPRCGVRLAWVETGRLGGIVYDYYRWCQSGCGLYCYNRSVGAFERLAGGG